MPLPTAAAEALAVVPPSTPHAAPFPGDRGGYLKLHEWRRDEWTPAVRAAGLAHRSPYALRHTYAPSRSPPACRCSSSRGSRAPPSSRSTAATATCYRTAIDRTRTAMDAFLAYTDADGWLAESIAPVNWGPTLADGSTSRIGNFTERNGLLYPPSSATDASWSAFAPDAARGRRMAFSRWR